MANFAFNPKWRPGVRQLETSDPVVAGPDGVDNIAPRQLSERTDFLKEFLDDQYGEIHNIDGSPKSELILPVSRGGTGLANSVNDQFLRGNPDGGYNSVSGKDIIDQLQLMAFYDVPPLINVSPVIYVLGKGFMEWQTIGSWSDYARLDIGWFVPDTTPLPRSMTIDAIGGIFSKTAYPGLWAWAQWAGHVVGAASWKEGQYKFVDLGGTSFKVPDLRNQFIRMTGTDADNANARTLGSYQQDALQYISGELKFLSNGSSNTGLNPAYGAFKFTDGDSGTTQKFQMTTSTTGLISHYRSGDFDASRVARTAIETRASNTAFAPRIIAF